MLRVFEIVIIQAKRNYNSYFFVLKEELEQHGGVEVYIHKLEKQEIKTEPLVIRANAGDDIEIHITDTMHKEVLTEYFFTDSEPRTVLLHSHFFINSHKQCGIYGALIIEEEGATFHNPYNGQELYFGTQAVIRRKNGTAFREFILFVYNSDAAKGINYHIEPVIKRLENCKEPAYIFSSFIHGDPATPILETYPDDELVIHMLDGTQDLLNIAGISGHLHPDKCSLSVTEKYSAGDYLYYFGDITDMLNGLWGIIRVYGQHNKILMPLCSSKEHNLLTSFAPKNDSVINHYKIAAISTRMIYNKQKNQKFDRTIFVPIENLEMVLAGKSKPEPLILYANDKEWIEVILYNALDTRIALNPQLLQYEPVHNSAINIGYNEWEQTVAPGESRCYLWYTGKGYRPSILQAFNNIIEQQIQLQEFCS